MKTELTRADILAPAAFEAVRVQKRAEVRAAMRPRRVEVGPFATFIFEQFSSIWLQVHEMLRIEKGGEAQIDDELAAYNSLIPKGNNLAATLMLEIAYAGLGRESLASSAASRTPSVSRSAIIPFRRWRTMTSNGRPKKARPPPSIFSAFPSPPNRSPLSLPAATRLICASATPTTGTAPFWAQRPAAPWPRISQREKIVN